MHFPAILAAVLGSLAVAAPTHRGAEQALAAMPSSPPPKHLARDGSAAAAPDVSMASADETMSRADPVDCPKIEYECTHCNGDFDCETRPDCEWCWENGRFGTF